MDMIYDQNRKWPESHRRNRQNIIMKTIGNNFCYNRQSLESTKLMRKEKLDRKL